MQIRKWLDAKATRMDGTILQGFWSSLFSFHIRKNLVTLVSLLGKKTASLANLNISFFSGGFTSYYKHCELINWKEEKLKWKENREGEEEFAIEERGEGTPAVWSHSKAESKD